MSIFFNLSTMHSHKSVFALILITVLTLANTKTKVSVYYEALCSDSARFIVKQLKPTFLLLQDSIDLELIPYGKAIHNLEDGKWAFDCQHGPDECLHNKYHSCVWNFAPNTSVALNFVDCAILYWKKNDLDRVQQCIERDTTLNWTRINQCGNSTEGDALLAANGDKTFQLSPNIGFVPTIVFDDTFDEKLQDESLMNFKYTLCKKLQYPKPNVCTVSSLK